MSEYQKGKERARAEAHAWQLEFDGKCLSWSEVAAKADRFQRLAKRFGLVREFRENGVI